MMSGMIPAIFLVGARSSDSHGVDVECVVGAEIEAVPIIDQLLMVHLLNLPHHQLTMPQSDTSVNPRPIVENDVFDDA
jgi:hypothetical protein